MLRGIGKYVRRHHVALLALFVALGGTAIAAGNGLLPKNSVGAAQLKKNAVTGPKIKNGVIAKQKLTAAAIAALKGARGPTGPKGTQGGQGQPGPAGTARAWARVAKNGSLETARSHNVTSVIHLSGTGIYCLELAGSIPALSTGAAASPYYPGDDTNPTEIAHAEFYGKCGLNGAEVHTWLVDVSVGSLRTTLTDESFFAVIP
jgi:hypothetical protein